MSLWRNRLACSTVNRKVGGSSPPRDDKTFVYTFSYMVCPCGNKPVAEATDHNQDAGSTTSQPKCDKKNNRGNKKGSKKGKRKTKAIHSMQWNIYLEMKMCMPTTQEGSIVCLDLEGGYITMSLTTLCIK